MCGINGISWKNEALVTEMNDAIKHRGPDFQDVKVVSNATLGHVRLSIVDLDARANQPMRYSYKGKEYWIVFNGEIYNYKELREKLKTKGFSFLTESDTEVLLAAYIYYGKDVVYKLNGMWAFCIYDNNEFFCSRDRVGKKPLYFIATKQKFAFSSQISGLLPLLEKKEIDEKAVKLYFALGFIPSPLTIFKDVKKLPAGSNLIWQKGKGIKVNKYFRLKTYKVEKDKKSLLYELHNTLLSSVELRWERSDVPVGIFLSSGIDSNLLYALLRDKMPKVFTVKFYDKKFDESSLVASWVPDVHIIEFNKEIFNKMLKEYFKAYDEPFADYSSFALMLLSMKAREHIKVAISGDGGDEVFGGYEVYRAYKISRLFSNIPYLSKLATKLQKRCKELSQCWKILEIIRLSEVKAINWWVEWLKDVKYYPDEYKQWVNEGMKMAKDKDELETLLNFDIYYRTLGDNYLTKVDRASMLYGLEVRNPYLDFNMLNLAKRIPSKWKVGFKKGKILLREYAKNLLPKQILRNKKRGFTPPLKELFEGKDRELRVALNLMVESNIIPKEIQEFYENKVFGKEHEIALTYKMRLWIFKKWSDKFLKT